MWGFDAISFVTKIEGGSKLKRQADKREVFFFSTASRTDFFGRQSVFLFNVVSFVLKVILSAQLRSMGTSKVSGNKFETHATTS